MNKEFLPEKFQKVLLGDDTSKPNKLWLAIGWSRDYYIEWRWQSIEQYSRLQFKFSQEDQWLTAKSHEEDVLPKLKFAVKRNTKSQE